MPACDGDPCAAAFNSACCSTSNAGGNHHSVQKPAPWGRPPRMPWPIGQSYAHPVPAPRPPPRPSNPAPATTPRATVLVPVASVHPPPHLRLVHAPPTQQRSHLRHAQQQRPLRFPDPLRSSQRPPSYPNPVRVSPWLWFSCHAAQVEPGCVSTSTPRTRTCVFVGTVVCWVSINAVGSISSTFEWLIVRVFFSPQLGVFGHRQTRTRGRLRSLI